MSVDIKEHAYAVVTRDVPDEGLRRGDVGVVVGVHHDAAGEAIGYTLETFTIEGETVAVVSVPADAVRASTGADVTAARQVAAE
jgi:hypothetical protein